MRMLTRDRSLVEIQEAVEDRYAAYAHFRTPTPLPPADYVAPAYRPGP